MDNGGFQNVKCALVEHGVRRPVGGGREQRTLNLRSDCVKVNTRLDAESTQAFVSKQRHQQVRRAYACVTPCARFPKRLMKTLLGIWGPTDGLEDVCFVATTAS